MYTKLTKIMQHNLGYNEEGRAAFKREAPYMLRVLATTLGLKPGEFDVRYNPGGIAGSGSATLHTDSLYVQIEQTSMGKGHEILYRSCNGRKDYVGGVNHFASVSELEDPEAFAAKLRRLAVRAAPTRGPGA